jgi:hypothetical protein
MSLVFKPPKTLRATVVKYHEHLAPFLINYLSSFNDKAIHIDAGELYEEFVESGGSLGEDYTVNKGTYTTFNYLMAFETIGVSSCLGNHPRSSRLVQCCYINVKMLKKHIKKRPSYLV